MSLHQRFVQLSLQRKNLTRQLQALLPEIYKREIFKQRGCVTIYEYAWKYAGFSKALVDKVIQVSRHLEDKPHLKAMISKEGIHKVGLVSTIATPETDQIFAGHVENMSKAALFQFAKEVRHNGVEQKCHAVPEKIKIELDEEMQILFLQLKKDLKKESKRELSHKEALKMIFEKLFKVGCMQNAFIAKKKFKKSTSQTMPNQCSIPGNGIQSQSTDTKEAHPGVKTKHDGEVKRYIPAKVKRQILSQTNNKCAYPNCNKPYEILHHRERFADNKSHESIIPLCKEHHEFAHNGLIKNETSEGENWQLNIVPKMSFVDGLFLKYRTG